MYVCPETKLELTGSSASFRAKHIVLGVEQKEVTDALSSLVAKSVIFDLVFVAVDWTRFCPNRRPDIDVGSSIQ